MVYIYCDRASESAKEITAGLNGTRIRKFDGFDLWRRGRRIPLHTGDTVICWGTSFPEQEGVTVVNGTQIENKFEAGVILRQSGVPSPQFAHPGDATPGSFLAQGWLPRRFYHVGGNDLLLTTLPHPDYWSLKEVLTEEYRIHSFSGASIRAGKKMPREGYIVGTEAEYHASLRDLTLPRIAHPWIRSFDAGWRINYDGFKSTKALRQLAHTAVNALGLTFGAVDIGVRSDGRALVLEVNRAPGAEGGTLEKYLLKFQKLLSGEENEKDVEADDPPAPVAVVAPAADVRRARKRVMRVARRDLPIPRPPGDVLVPAAGGVEALLEPHARRYTVCLFGACRVREYLSEEGYCPQHHTPDLRRRAEQRGELRDVENRARGIEEVFRRQLDERLFGNLEPREVAQQAAIPPRVPWRRRGE